MFLEISAPNNIPGTIVQNTPTIPKVFTGGIA